jgi:hypothetical protein
MSKAILRIGTWLNRLVDGEHQDQGVVLQTNPSWSTGHDHGE